MITNINKKLVAIRLNKKLTQSQFGKLLQLSRDTVAKWENGEVTPSIRQINNISDKLNLHYCWICESADYKLKNNIATLDNKIVFALNNTSKQKKQAILTLLKIK